MSDKPILIAPLHRHARWKAAQKLGKIANHLVRNEYEMEPHAVIVILVSNDDAGVIWSGIKWQDEVDRAVHALQDAQHPDNAKRREEWEREQAEKLVAWERDNPFVCGLGRCQDRFKTQRGLDAHRRRSRGWRHEPVPERPVQPPSRPHAVPAPSSKESTP